MCCMVIWWPAALATAILVASTHAFTPKLKSPTLPPVALACPSVEGLAIGSSGVARRAINHHFKHMKESLWARRRSGVAARLSPAETGVPEVAARPDVVSAPDLAGKEGGGGSSPSSKKLTERGGLLLLATVPLVWGTYGPSVKLLYQMGESPPGLLFNFACYAVSVMTFAAVASFSRANKGQRPGVFWAPPLTFSCGANLSRGCSVLSVRPRGSLVSWCKQPVTPPEEQPFAQRFFPGRFVCMYIDMTCCRM